MSETSQKAGVVVDPPDLSEVSPGQYHLTTLYLAYRQKATGDTLKDLILNNQALLQESAKRFLEEAVELAISCEVQPGDILLHVTDALHSEAKKASINKTVYPSQFNATFHATNENRLVEIADVEICVDLIRAIASIPREHIEAHKAEKLELLRLRVRDGAYQLVGRRIYKKER